MGRYRGMKGEAEVQLRHVPEARKRPKLCLASAIPDAHHQSSYNDSGHVSHTSTTKAHPHNPRRSG
jgi:hypothetical protein